MPGPLTDKAWREFCQIAEDAGLHPDDDARGEMEACLFVEYPWFAYDSARSLAALKQAERELARCDKLNESVRQKPVPPDDFKIKRERDLYYIKMLIRRA